MLWPVLVLPREGLGGLHTGDPVLLELRRPVGTHGVLCGAHVGMVLSRKG